MAGISAPRAIADRVAPIQPGRGFTQNALQRQWRARYDEQFLLDGVAKLRTGGQYTAD